MNATQTDRYGTTHRPAAASPEKGKSKDLAVGVGLGLFSVALGVAELFAPRALARMIGVRQNSAAIRAVGVREIVSGIGLLAAPRAPVWRWARVAGDLMDLALLGAGGSDRAKSTKAAIAVLGVTAVDLAAGAAGERHAVNGDAAPAPIKAVATIDRSPEACYSQWSEPKVLETVMTLVESVRESGDQRTHWTMRLGNKKLEWESEYTERVEPRRISWRSLPDEPIRTSGSVMFEPAPGGRGTVVRLEMVTPKGGGLLGKLFGRMKAKKDLHRFKQFMELGFVPSADGPSGPRGAMGKLLEKAEA